MLPLFDIFIQNGVLEEGWTGLQASGSNSLLGAEADDPVIQQINIIQGYIRQAREAMRFEEVRKYKLVKYYFNSISKNCGNFSKSNTRFKLIY